MSKKLQSVPMKTFWGELLVEINANTGNGYTDQRYIADVCRGNKSNKAIDSVRKKCIQTVISNLKGRGLKPRYNVYA